MPRKRSKAFWNNFKFKYKLTIINENTLEEIVGRRVSKPERAFGAVVRAGGAFSDCRLHHCLHPFAQLSPRIYEQ